jgi:hypothetical protein
LDIQKAGSLGKAITVNAGSVASAAILSPEKDAAHAPGEENQTPEATPLTTGGAAKRMSWINQSSSSGFNLKHPPTTILPNGTCCAVSFLRAVHQG